MNILLDYLSHLLSIVVRDLLSDPRVGAVLLFVASRFGVVLFNGIVGELSAWGSFSLID